ncbi:translin-like isoform X1 [Sapajus apella]|uniref:Translin-like isoform X1 n=1 Tax=Sapajus apella TaxID=9515 RepID=A0A6J3HCS4_SAPAP|nr:translin-like isoform X1 [Sapajus apella]
MSIILYGEYKLKKFHEHWRFVLRRLVFLAAFVVYLETETLVTQEAVTEILGIEPDREKGFHLDVEDYLSGALILASELGRQKWSHWSGYVCIENLRKMGRMDNGVHLQAVPLV